MKRYLILGLIVFCLFNINVNASTKTFERTEANLLLPTWINSNDVDKNAVLNTLAIDANEKIYDFADCLTDAEEAKLYNYAKEYISHTKYDIAILTVNDLKGTDIKNYTYNFYDYNSFGRNGIMITVYKHDNKNEIFIGITKYGEDSKIEQIYTPNYIEGMVKYLKDLYNDNNYYQGSNDFIKLGIGIYDIQTNTNGNFRVNANGDLVKNIYWLDYLVISLAITSIVIVLLIYISGNNKKTINKDYLNKSTLIVNKVSEEMIDEPEK